MQTSFRFIMGSLLISSIFLFYSCGSQNSSKNDKNISSDESSNNNSNIKLKQENAEKAIKEFMKKHPIQNYVPEYAAQTIEPISQFNENEANGFVSMKSPSNTNEVLNFSFKKDINNSWIMTSVNYENQVGHWESFLKWFNKIENSDRLNITVQ